mmetsp:Transcript_29765/g.65011  ORF Transcript_29765/g.65011 Transcript_29765/m.65011 type:complete len:154 (-) Transcript_29765:545-1006(-)|eukprot:CAMPEP_0118954136 /NCGR_PEP_ID=MMETSP1169-20130426/57740_1 /TAXON_ID=36882 /ORGANISM="Pyramimonas obovata, Strain CCMP722" /LENGTH=153 /DNA_ID=CAMNT_0006901719 /DNA_START=48 /DNA_END=509 /DNA_ORIENTATION=+
MATAVRTLNATTVCNARNNGRTRSFTPAKSLRPSSAQIGRRNARVSLNAKNSKQPEAVVEEDEEEEEVAAYEEPKMSWAGVRQLISMGMGTMAGDITEINLNDPARTVVMELEANNLEDEKGDVKKGKYFEEGWVDDTPSGPGFFENLFGKKK